VLQISEKTGKPVTDVKNAIIWGNHSSTQYPDVNHGTVDGTPIREAVKDDDWLNGDFISTVQQRGAAIIKVSILEIGPINYICLQYRSNEHSAP
jgi:malate dehydrogenase